MNQPLFIKTFEIDIYNVDIIFVIHPDFNEVDKKYKLKLKETFDPEDPNEAHAITQRHPDYNGRIEIYFLCKPNYLNIDSFGHEIVNLVTSICSTKGIEVDIDNDEPIAYLSGYLSKKLGEFVYSYMEKNKIDLKKFFIYK